MTVLALIPARYASTRFPGKPLAPIAGRPMIEHVFSRARAVPSVDRVVVATDDERILEAVLAFGGEAVLTRPDHPSGTDRLAEAADLLGALDQDVVVNIQGDQPAFDPNLAADIVRPLLADPGLVMTTPAVPLADLERARDPNVVKVVFDRNMRALYFSRAPIPWPREGGPIEYHRHIGMYAYRAGFLRRFVRLPQGRLETLEKLEQLRALEHGYPIQVVLAAQAGPDVDVPEDLARVEAFFKREGRA
jgi:3-deoxy-manno-octulosonate cytidylyltransferase (CMP-KDO synthetase)